jgi:hypothetical protein
VKLKSIRFRIVLDMTSKSHVLIEIAGEEKTRGETEFSDKMIDVMFACPERLASRSAINLKPEGPNPHLRNKTSSGDLFRARQRAPDETLYSGLMGGLCEIPTLLLFARGVPFDFLL